MSASTFQNIITVNDKDGKATFYKRPQQPVDRVISFGVHTTVYTNPSLPVDMSYTATSDLDSTATTSQVGLGNGRVAPENGIHACTLVLRPGQFTPMHRTQTLDMGVVLEGEIELELDNGEKVVLKQGDTFVQRGTIHAWTNRTDRDTKVFATQIGAKLIVDANGDTMAEEWL